MMSAIMTKQRRKPLRLVHQAKRDASTLKDKIKRLSTLDTLHAPGVTISGRSLDGEEGEEEGEEIVKGFERSRRTRTGKKEQRLAEN